MGCSASMYSIRRKKPKRNIPQVSIFVPPLRIPVHSDDLHKMLRGLIPKDIVDRISYLRNQIVLVAEDTGMLIKPIGETWLFFGR